MSNRSALAVLYAAISVVIFVFIRETSWSVIVDFTMDQLAGWLGVERAKMIANAAPYVITLILTGFLLTVAYQLGLNKSAGDVRQPDINANDAFDLILTRSKWAKSHRHNWKSLPRVMYEKDRPEATVIDERLKAEFGREIHNKLRSGKITCWGRESFPNSGAHLTPEKEIAADNWDQLVIRGTEERQPYARYEIGRRAGDLAFVGLRFCKKQIGKEFPAAWLSR
jgi:hypothetical protein